jgi:uncharacterized protein YbjT (DUF2867 family)
MRVLVFGATGRTGQCLIALAERAGVRVHAAGRDPARLAVLPKGTETSLVDVSDASKVRAVAQAAAPAAIISLIGGQHALVDESGNILIANAALHAGIRRVIQVSSLGCGDSRAYASERLLAAIGTVLEAKTRAEDHLRGLDLDWTIIRPGGLTDGEATGNGAFYDDPRVHGRISRADLAALILACLTAEHTIGKVLAAVDRTTLSGPSDPREFAVIPRPVPADILAH